MAGSEARKARPSCPLEPVSRISKQLTCSVQLSQKQCCSILGGQQRLLHTGPL